VVAQDQRILEPPPASRLFGCFAKSLDVVACPFWPGLVLNHQFSSHASGVRLFRIHQPPVARYASLTGG